MSISFENLEKIKETLQLYKSTVDNVLYHNYSRVDLENELNDIQDIIDIVDNEMIEIKGENHE